MISTQSEYEVRKEVREFYDSVGWQNVGEGLYQNARYEDLRPVSREYITRCHQRVAKSLPSTGKLILDAGCGPIQYPEYLEYSAGFDRRVCLDISRRALMEARSRIGDHGLFVVGDVARLPFEPNAFHAAVSLHTVHHVPLDSQPNAFREIYRVLRKGSGAVIVNSWGSHSKLMRWAEPAMRFTISLRKRIAQWRGRADDTPENHPGESRTPRKTYTSHSSPKDLERALSFVDGLEIRVWRSINTGFMRAFIDPRFFGKGLLRLIYRLEEFAPHWFGRWGQYPMILISKPSGDDYAVE